MDPSRNYFTALTQVVKKTLDEAVLVKFEIVSDRALWEIHGSFGSFQIRLKEIFSALGRMYSYSSRRLDKKSSNRQIEARFLKALPHTSCMCKRRDEHQHKDIQNGTNIRIS